MNKNLTANIIPLFIAVLVYTCNSSSDMKKDSDDKKISKQEVNYNPYFPASVGNKWEYGSETADNDPQNINVDIISIKNVGKDEIVELNSFPFFSKKVENTKLKFKENGEVDLLNDYKEEIFIPEINNLINDYTWQFGQWNGYITSVRDSVITDKEKIENCIKLNYALSITLNVEIWIAKDKGIVRWGYNRTNPPILKPLYYILKNLTLSK